MDIKVGDYVRIDNDFRIIALGIGKVIRTNQDTIYVKMNFEMPFSFKIEDITKHSKNIIDLIEVGDIVEYQVNSLSKLKIGRVKSYRDARSNKEYLGVEGFDITKIYIKSILTHEQYNANCYKIEQK